MRLFCLAFLAIVVFPGLCLAQPGERDITDDIGNQPAVTQPQAPPAETLETTPLAPETIIDDSAEVTLPATVRVTPEDNATLPADNATLPQVDVNATIPAYNATIPAYNATIPAYNATIPAYNATIPAYNATIPAYNATIPAYNATIPAYNATIPAYNATLPAYNATLPAYNATIPAYNATIPAYNATIPAYNATLPQVDVNTTRPMVNVTAPTTVTPPKPISVADFLVKAPEKKPEPTQPEPQKAEAKKAEPKKPEPKKPEAKKPEAKKPEDKKPEAEKPEPKSQKVASGQKLKIPPNAAKTGDMSFLEGCWRGYRPEYNSKRMITERFCFDDSGVGKRIIKDPAHAGECYGSTRALLNKDGVLHMDSQQAVCTSGDIWGESEMICKGEGNETPCSWNFSAFNNKASQSYKISFVRE